MLKLNTKSLLHCLYSYFSIGWCNCHYGSTLETTAQEQTAGWAPHAIQSRTQHLTEAPRATQWTSAVLVIIFQGHRCILKAPRLNYQLWACQPQMFQNFLKVSPVNTSLSVQLCKMVVLSLGCTPESLGSEEGSFQNETPLPETLTQ